MRGGFIFTWHSEHPLTREFTIERSDNGQDFEPFGRLPVTPQNDLYTFIDNNAPDRVVYYRLWQHLGNGAEQVAGTIKLGHGAGETQEMVTLLGNHPNPFNPRTTISYEVFADQHVEISVLDLSGHLVSLLVDRWHEAGSHKVSFGGTDCTSGIDFVRLKTSTGHVQTRQIVLTK